MQNHRGDFNHAMHSSEDHSLDFAKMLLDLFRSKSNDTSQGTDTSSTKPGAGEPVCDEDDREAFSAYAQNLPPPSDWPNNSPLIVVPSHRAKDILFSIPEQCNGGEASLSILPMNGRAIPFKGPIFSGKLVSRMLDVPTTPNECQNMSNQVNPPFDNLENSIVPPVCSKIVYNQDYFQNRSRQYQWCVQGRFKRRIRFDKIVTGQEFGRPFRNTPSSRIVKKGLDLLKHKLPETFDCDLFSDEPHFEHPLLAGCQSFRIDKPEDVEGLPEADIYGIGDDGNVIEDTNMLRENDDSVPQDGVARRKYFAKNCNLERHYFEPDLVYTFDFFANFFSPARHRLELTPFFSVDLIPYFNGYPLFMSMAKEKESQEYLWATEMWHQRLLNYDESPGRLARFFSGSDKSETDNGADAVDEDWNVVKS